MKQAKDYLIFALDVPTLEEAGRYVAMLESVVGMFKIGLELFTQSGPEIIHVIRKASGGAGIFLDLKLHDIPETVRRTMAIIADLGVTFTTVHCADSKSMLAAAVDGAAGRTGILGVTVLTSIHTAELRTAGYAETFARDVNRLVLKRAAMAKDAGLSGVISSPREAGLIKSRFGKEFLAITPGIRPAWETTAAHDQKRVLTPAEAILNGSDYLVIGRPIRDAADPASAAAKILEEIGSVIP